MRATKVLKKCLGDALNQMHAQRARTPLHAVEALTYGRRLILMDQARSWPRTERIRARRSRLWIGCSATTTRTPSASISIGG